LHAQVVVLSVWVPVQLVMQLPPQDVVPLGHEHVQVVVSSVPPFEQLVFTH